MGMHHEMEARRKAWSKIHSGRTIWDALNIEASCTIGCADANAGLYAKPWFEGEWTGGLFVAHKSGERAAWLVALDESGLRCRWQLCDPGKAEILEEIHRSGRQVLNGKARFADSQTESSPAGTFAIVRSVTPPLRDFRPFGPVRPFGPGDTG